MFYLQLKEIGDLYPIRNIHEYIHIVNRYPILNKNEENILAEKVFIKRDRNAAKILVLCNLKFVIYIVNKYIGYGLPKSDLIQEGNIGLIKAIHRFNPTLGVKLITFAVYWIKAEIHEFIFRNWRIVKIATTKNQRRLFFNLRKNKYNIGLLKEHYIDKISDILGIAIKDIKNMELRMENKDIYLEDNRSKYIINNSSKYTYTMNIFHLKDISSNFADNLEKDNSKNYNLKRFNIAINNLDLRSRQIIQYRWLNPIQITLQQLSIMYGISKERVRQLEHNAIKMLKKVFLSIKMTTPNKSNHILSD